MQHRLPTLAISLFSLFSGIAAAQQAPAMFQVLMYASSGKSTAAPFGASVFSVNSPVSLGNVDKLVTVINNPTNFSDSQSMVQLNSAINSSIATALSVIPLASPASGVILKKDPTTGAELDVSSTLGGIYTERAETIGKGKFYIGFTHQNFHFTSLNGESLNGITILNPNGAPSAFTDASGQAVKGAPVTVNLGLDVRLSQDVTFLTYGVTNRFDVSLGLPMVHAAVAATSYNGQIFAGRGDATQNNNTNCWCADTFQPGFPSLTASYIGQANLSKTGFGDMLLRLKGTVVETPHAVVAIGTDLRFATGDERNFLGTGTTSVKPFLAVSLYNKPFRNGIVLSPHLNLGWQISGKSVLGGQIQGTVQSATYTAPNGTGTATFIGAPFTSTKDFLPDVFTWAIGTEIALGRRMTFVADILGDQIGWIHGIPNTQEGSAPGLSPFAPFGPTNAVGIVSAGRTSIGQYSGAFGYKAKVAGNLVATFNALVRFNDSGLTARFVPLFGLGYTFGH